MLLWGWRGITGVNPGVCLVPGLSTAWNNRTSHMEINYSLRAQDQGRDYPHQTKTTGHQSGFAGERKCSTLGNLLWPKWHVPSCSSRSISDCEVRRKTGTCTLSSPYLVCQASEFLPLAAGKAEQMGKALLEVMCPFKSASDIMIIRKGFMGHQMHWLSWRGFVILRLEDCTTSVDIIHASQSFRFSNVRTPLRTVSLNRKYLRHPDRVPSAKPRAEPSAWCWETEAGSG